MTRNHLHCSAPLFFTVLWPWVVLAAPCQTGQACVCLQCPPGQEPSLTCSEVEVPNTVVECHRCPAGTFSDSHSPDQCNVHTECRGLNRQLLTPGTLESDAVCGACLPGFYPAQSTQSSSTLHSCRKKSLVRLQRNAGKGTQAGEVELGGAGVGGTNSSAVQAAGENTTEYIVFALVPVFCIIGLLGILFCNLLKKKGYKCTQTRESEDEEAGKLQKEGDPCPYVIEDQYEDTISVLVRFITGKKENASALEEMLLEYENKKTSVSKGSSFKFPGFPQFRSLPRLCTHQQHLHTINGLALHPDLGCWRCSQKKWPHILLPLTTETDKASCASFICSSPDEARVLNVGRFQVAQIMEGDPVSVATTPVPSSDTDSVDSTLMGSAEVKALLQIPQRTDRT